MLELYMCSSSLVTFSSDFLIIMYFHNHALFSSNLLKLQKFNSDPWCDRPSSKHKVSLLLHRVFWSKGFLAPNHTRGWGSNLCTFHGWNLSLSCKNITCQFSPMLMIWRKIGTELNWSGNENQLFTTLYYTKIFLEILSSFRRCFKTFL